MIITIDGPSGTGKSTVAKCVSEKLGFLHLDTGAFYRAMAYMIIKNSIDANNQQLVEQFVQGKTVTVTFIQRVPHYFVESCDTTPYIRTAEVSKIASLIASYPEVRKQLIIAQRKLASGVNVVCEGRDMGSNVFPNAEVKVFLTAQPQIRAVRRFQEFETKGLLSEGMTVETVLKDLTDRDSFDSSRAIDPLKIPEGATILDTSNMSIDDVVNRVMELAF